MPRLFVAQRIVPPQPLLRLLARFRQAAPAPVRIAGRIVRLKPVDPDHAHFTLAFLGEVGEEPVGPLGDLLDVAVRSAGVAPFVATLGPVGLLPPGGRRPPRVIYAGVADPAPMASLTRAVNGALAAAGFPPDTRAFRPHLTLARLAPRRGEPPIEEAIDVNTLLPPRAHPLGETPITDVQLIQSTLTPRGPIYQMRHRSRLLPS